MPSKNCQDDGVVFGDWKLFPVDERNWELCHRQEVKDTPKAREAGTAGVVQWRRLGRFYGYNTFDLAIQYAADVELKAKASSRAMELMDALREYERIVDRLMDDVRDALGKDA